MTLRGALLSEAQKLAPIALANPFDVSVLCREAINDGGTRYLTYISLFHPSVLSLVACLRRNLRDRPDYTPTTLAIVASPVPSPRSNSSNGFDRPTGSLASLRPPHAR